MLRALNNFIGLRECRLALSGAAPIAPDMLRFFRALGVPIREGYGMTETAGVVTVQRSAASPVGTVGSAVPGVELRIADDGELLVRGPTVFKGYYRNDAATAEAIDTEGWLHTGDVAQAVRGPEGEEVRIVDRKKDMILVSGFNVYPTEIEQVVSLHPGVLECAAVGIPDERSGEAVKLFVVKKDGATISEDDIAGYCRDNFTAYKRPKIIEFRDDLPKSNVGKILRRELRSDH